ncbi:hypothetical protein NA78x_005777 [Anatilimnocola sp. NA78]|uniref:hypothetical protein n=1 Tax=Anatilimnocola sp. NA78 TaxID=3415683 RepID=UPI003CE5BFEA
MAKKPTSAQLKAIKAQETLDRAIAVLRAQRSESAEPLTVQQLANKLCDDQPAAFLKLLTGATGKGQVTVFAAKDLDSPIVLPEDYASLGETSTLQRRAAQAVRTKRERKGPLGKDVKSFIKDAGAPFKAFAATWETLFTRQLADRTLVADLADLIVAKAVPPTPAEIATKWSQEMLRRGQNANESQVVTLAQLQAAAKADAKSLAKVLKEPAFAERVVEVASGDATNERSFVLREHLRGRTAEFIKLGLALLVDGAPAKGKSKAPLRSTIFTAAEIATALIKVKQLKVSLEEFIGQAADQNRLGSGLNWLVLKNERAYFRLADAGREVTPSHTPTNSPTPASARPSATTTPPPVASATVTAPSKPAEGFASLFDAAFRRVDSRSGGRNFAKVLELRRELPQFSRSEFDSELRLLRAARQFAMESAQGGGTQLSDEERQAGIQEGSSLLVYVSRI